MSRFEVDHVSTCDDCAERRPCTIVSHSDPEKGRAGACESICAECHFTREEAAGPLAIDSSRCRGCGAIQECVFCAECAQKERCGHGQIVADGCDACDRDGDFAFDAAREGG